MTTIGILGAGAIGRAIAHTLTRRGIAATIANSRGPETLHQFVRAEGATLRAGTREEAAAQDLVFLAVPWSRLPAALHGLPSFAGRIVVDANNPIEAPRFVPVDLGAQSSSAIVASLAVGARVVKAFNHLEPGLLQSDAMNGGTRVLFLAGDDAPAKAEVRALIERLGFLGIDLGSLDTGGRLMQFPGGALPGLDLVRFAKPSSGGAEPNFDAVLAANLERVFNERDPALREAAVAALYVETPVMYEPAGVVHGREAIAATAGKVLEQLGPTFRFRPVGRAAGHHGTGSLRWEGGPEGGSSALTGIDTAEVRDGRIARLWVLIDAPR